MTEEQEPQEETPKARWEKRNEFRITGQMREVVKLTIKACEAQITLYQRKIEKLQYGA